MKAKILKHKNLECYGKYMLEGNIYSCSIPYLYPMTFTLKELEKYVSDIEGFQLMAADWKVIVVDITEVK